MSSRLLRYINRPRRWRAGNSIVPDPEMLDYYFEEYQIAGVIRSLIRSDPPSRGISQKLPLGTDAPKKLNGLVGPLDAWLVRDMLNDMMN